MKLDRTIGFRNAPRTALLGICSLVALLVHTCSLWPVEPLHDRPGFDAAGEYLAAHPGDLILVWPPHLSAATEHLPAGPLVTDSVPAQRNGLRRFVRIQLLGPSGVSRPPELKHAEILDRRRFGAVEILALRLPHDTRLTYDLRAQLDSAQVRLRGDPAIECNTRRPGGGWSCPGRPGWNHVAPTTLSVGGEPHACVWAHPVEGRALELDLGTLQLWDHVRLEAALSDDAATTRGGAPVHVELEILGVGKRRLTRTNAPGVAHTVLETPAGRGAPVRVRITTPRDARRHLCINVFILDAVEEPS